MNILMDEMVTAINALAFTLPVGESDVPVLARKRKLPSVGETLDTLPVIVVCPAEKGDDFRPFTTGGFWRATYYIQVVIIAANNQDMSTNLDYYTGFRETIRNTFRRNIGSIVPVAITRNSAKTIDRTLVNQNYDYMPLDIAVSIVHKL